MPNYADVLDEILKICKTVADRTFAIFAQDATMLAEQRAATQSAGAFNVQILQKLDEILTKLG